MIKSFRFIGWHFVGGILLASGIIGLAGCSSKGTLSGKVTYKEQPVPKGARIVFLHVKSDHSYPFEVTSDDGSYRAEGLPVGDYQVAVKPFTSATIGNQGPMGGNIAKAAKMPEGKDLIQPPKEMFQVFDPSARQSFNIPNKYTEPQTSGITVTVKGGKQPFDIPISD